MVSAVSGWVWTLLWVGQRAGHTSDGQRDARTRAGLSPGGDLGALESLSGSDGVALVQRGAVCGDVAGLGERLRAKALQPDSRRGGSAGGDSARMSIFRRLTENE